MSWTANLDSAQAIKGDATVSVTFTSDTGKMLTEVYAFADPVQFKQTIINRVAQLEKLDELLPTLTPGPVDITPVVAPPDPPTQDELDRMQFLADYLRWLRIKAGIDAGVINEAATEVTEFKAKVIKAYKAEYLDVV